MGRGAVTVCDCGLSIFSAPFTHGKNYGPLLTHEKMAPSFGILSKKTSSPFAPIASDQPENFGQPTNRWSPSSKHDSSLMYG